MNLMNDAMRAYAKEKLGVAANASDDVIKKALGDALIDGKIDQAAWAELQGNKTPTAEDRLRGIIREEISGGKTHTVKTRAATPDPMKAMAGIRVVGAGEKYGTTRVAAKHAKTGQPVPFRGGEAERLSELELAKLGAWQKRLARKAGLNVAWTEHDAALLDEAIHQDEWLVDQGNNTVVIQGANVKALLEDGISGGTSLAPLYYDDQLVVQLLLNSELAPFVDMVDVPVGRYVQTESLGIPTASWGIPSGTSMPLFDTTGLIGTLGSTIFPLTCAIEVGRDLLQDTPIRVGAALEAAIGQRFMTEFDKVVAVGDGLTQPLGIFSTPGLAVVASANGAVGPLTTADAESLIFGLPKPYRRAALNPTFVANDVSYRRFRAIPSGSSLENQRAFGYDEQSYQLFGYRFAVENDVPNSWASMVCLKKYRMYRRQGAESEWSKEGRSLMLNNTALLTVRARLGGRLVDGAAAVMLTDGPA